MCIDMCCTLFHIQAVGQVLCLVCHAVCVQCVLCDVVDEIAVLPEVVQLLAMYCGVCFCNEMKKK